MPVSTQTKQIMARRLQALMESTPALDTIAKVSKRSGVGFGTVRRVRNADSVDVQIGNVERIAACFHLSLVDFISDPDNAMNITASERQVITHLRSLDGEDRTNLVKTIARMASLKKASLSAEAIKDEQGAVESAAPLPRSSPPRRR